MKYLLLALIPFLTCCGLLAQPSIESNSNDIRMKQGTSDRIIINSGTVSFPFSTSPILGVNDIVGDRRISLVGNQFFNFGNPEISLTGNLENGEDNTLLKLRNELHSGTWGLGLSAYRNGIQDLNSFHITLQDQPVLDINEDGDVSIESLKSQSGVLRPLFVNDQGEISTRVGQIFDHRIQYSQFTASDGDGSDVEIVRLGRGFGYVRYQSGLFSDDSGELVAPLQLPNGSNITRVSVSFINEADVDELYEISIHRAPIQPNGGSIVSTNWRTIPVGGSIIVNQLGPDTVTGSTHSINYDIDINTFSFLYSVVVRCENCSEQYLRSVTVVHTPPQ